jgi:uncharacterized phage protein (TIGR01671 family)
MSAAYSLADLAYEGFPPQYKNDYGDVLDKECIVMQYTGLKDKNGKEIYEGDFLQAENSDGVLGNIKGYVEYDKAKFVVHRYEGHTMAKMGNPLWTFRTSHIVVGNIYETPNLLTNEK